MDAELGRKWPLVTTTLVLPSPCHTATPMMLRLNAGVAILLALAGQVAAQETLSSAQGRLRLRDWGLKIGVYQPGPLDAITDVAGVRVGQVTLVEGDDVRTGVTAILPHDGNMFQDKVAAAVYVYNAFGKLVGATQVNELSETRDPAHQHAQRLGCGASLGGLDARPARQSGRALRQSRGGRDKRWLAQ
jgi:hypothetical protein